MFFSACEIEIWYTSADSLQNKLNELKVLLQSQSNKPKVVAITEVKHKHKNKKVKHKNKWQLSNSELQIDGYNLYINDLSDNVRGVAIYVSDELSCNQLYVESLYKDFVIIQLNGGTKEKLLIGNFYRSPNSSSVSDEELYT